MNAPEEIFLETGRGILAGLGQATSGGPPVLCLHGWLDNAASFIPLFRQWSGLNLLSLDFPGHGRSAHRHPEASYYFTEYLQDVDAALDALGWQSCHLAGHSMGGAVASLFAAASPERVRSLTLLDVLGPISSSPGGTTARLRRHIKASRKPPRRQKTYASIEEMIQTRQKNSDLNPEAARLLCERSIKQIDDRHVWSNDPELHWVSPILPTEEQALDCLQHIEAPVLALIAQPLAPYITRETLERRLAAIPDRRLQFIDGKHHFHMHQAKDIAPAVQSFILEQDLNYGKDHDPN